MKTFSNCTLEEFKKFEADLSLTAEKERPLIWGGDACRYAEDTGKRAFPAAPCRGNRIICHRIAGHTSYTKACTPEKCRFYEKKEEAWNA